jgi:hypothetical protein
MSWWRVISQAVGHRRGAQSRVQAVFGSGGESVLRPARRRAPCSPRQRYRAQSRPSDTCIRPKCRIRRAPGPRELGRSEMDDLLAGRARRQSLRSMISRDPRESASADGGVGRADHDQSSAAGHPERRTLRAGSPGVANAGLVSWPLPAASSRIRRSSSWRGRHAERLGILNLASGMYADSPAASGDDIPKPARLSRMARSGGIHR